MSCYTCVCSERHDALYVVGALDEVMELRGMKYHPIDIETSIVRAHRNITEWWAHTNTHVKTKASTLYVNMLISGGNYVDQCNYFILQ